MSLAPLEVVLARPARGWRSWAARLNPETWLLTAFLALLVGLWASYGSHFTMRKWTFGAPLVALGLLVAIAVGSRGRRLLRGDVTAVREVADFTATMARDWSPFIICYLIYENLQMMTRLVHPDRTYDATMAAFDGWLFGTQPSLWLQRLTSPALTDYFSFAYGSYFYLPVTLAVLTYLRLPREKFRVLMLAQVCTIYCAFLGYMLVPVLGPRIHLGHLYTNPPLLEGVFLYARQSALHDALQSVKTDCFPSLHTANSTVTLVFAFRYADLFPRKRIAFWIVLPVIVSLWVSTVYLRYHYVADVLAGFTLAAITTTAAPRIEAAWNRWRTASGTGATLPASSQ